MHKKYCLMLIFFTLATMAMPNDGNAQLIRQFGLKAGLSIAAPLANHSDGLNPFEAIKNVSVSGYLEWFNDEHFSMVSEIGHLQKGWKEVIQLKTLEFPNGTGEPHIGIVKLNSISIKLLAKVRLNISDFDLYGVVGPKIDMALSTASDAEGSEPSRAFWVWAFDRMRPFCYPVQSGLTFGIGCQVPKFVPLGIGIEARYSPDFDKILEHPFYLVKNQTWELQAVLTL